MNNINRYEEQFIFSIDRMRRNVNELLLCIPFILAFSFFLFGAPIVIVLCNVPIWSYPILFLGPIVLVTVIFIIRKKIIIKRFIIINDVSNQVDLTEIQSTDMERLSDETVFMFGYSDYMIKILYNWLYSLDVIGSKKLKMYKVFYDNYAPNYLAIREADLNITSVTLDRFQNETRMCTRLSDMTYNGKSINVKIYDRVASAKSSNK